MVLFCGCLAGAFFVAVAILDLLSRLQLQSGPDGPASHPRQLRDRDP